MVRLGQLAKVPPEQLFYDRGHGVTWDAMLGARHAADGPGHDHRTAQVYVPPGDLVGRAPRWHTAHIGTAGNWF